MFKSGVFTKERWADADASWVEAGREIIGITDDKRGLLVEH